MFFQVCFSLENSLFLIPNLLKFIFLDESNVEQPPKQIVTMNVYLRKFWMFKNLLFYHHQLHSLEGLEGLAVVFQVLSHF